MTIDELFSIKGVVAAGEFDEPGRLKGFKSKTLTKQQADSTAMLSGSLVSLLGTISSLYTTYCGVLLSPFRGVTVKGADYSTMLHCGEKTCLGVIIKNEDADYANTEKKVEYFSNHGVIKT